jgi:UDP-N-acetylglucosamine 2-epimerase (non-hydrolysing)
MNNTKKTRKNKIKKVLIVFGTRPEAIKMAPVIKEFLKYPQEFEIIVCVTAQHREMLDQVLNIFDIVPDIDLNLMQPKQDLTEITSRILLGMRDVLRKVQPNLVLVHGDTTTSSATALAAFYEQVAVGHIEAGLRTHNIYSPWPEELNRQITGRIASLHFAPTELNRSNLLKEGVDDRKIFVTGNTVIDAIKLALLKIDELPEIKTAIHSDLECNSLNKDLVNKWDGINGQRQMVLITGHRRENFGQGFYNICEAIKELAIMNPDVDFVFPVHLNPQVRGTVHNILGEEKLNTSYKNIFLTEPLEYLPFVYLMKKCILVLTDSGGIQEEAPGLGKPVLVMRDTTERPEGVEAGSVKLIGTSKELIVKEVNQLLRDRIYYRKVSSTVNPYGDGTASERISKVLLSIA